MNIFMYFKHLLCFLWLRLKVHCFFLYDKKISRLSLKSLGDVSERLQLWVRSQECCLAEEIWLLWYWNREKTNNLQECNFPRYHQPVYSRIQDSMLAPEINPELSKLILMNFPCREKINKWLKAELIDLFSLRAQKRSHPVVWGK